MYVGSNFELITHLQYKVKSLTFQVQSFESGNKYVSMRSEFARQLAAKDREIISLKRELAEIRHQVAAVRKNWMQVFEDVAKEHEKELRRKEHMIQCQGNRISQMETRINETKDMLTAKTMELYSVQTELEEQQGANLQLKAQLYRDYENSSIPSSQKPNHKKICNNREKTGRMPGGQPGHEGHRRKKHASTDHVHIPAPTQYLDRDNFKPTGKTICKQVVNVAIHMSVVEYDTPEFRNLRTGQRVHADFPAGVVNDVNYGGTVKAISFLLNNRCGVSIDKIRELLSDMTDGQLQVSKGMINGLSKEFSAKTDKEQKKAFSDLLVSPVMNADFTNARVNGKSAQVIICADPNVALYFARENKGHKGIAGTPAENYRGILVHDHDHTFYNYGDSHQECLSHTLRYLKNSIENEPNLTWNQKMLELVREMIHYRNSNEAPDPDKIQIYKSKYLEIVKLAKEEYEYEPPSQYYRDGYNLYLRMDRYKESHLLFLDDFRVPSNNNLSERKLRVFKRKQKQVMVFRSFESLSHLCSSMSMIDLFKSRESNLLKSIALVFE
ncbi:MAG: transposase [Geobacteraceae bacterium]|nr:transposase [Geobacteraceae bacterium]